MPSSAKARISVVLLGMLSITIVEVCALMNGIDGTILMIYLSIMSLAMGLAIPFEKFIKTN